MATNALAPASTNALSRGTDPLQTLLKQAAETPQYGELVEYLSARRMMPPIYQKGLHRTAEFAAPGLFSKNVPETGVVNLSYSADPNVVIHELTHAAQRQIESQYYALKAKGRTQKLKPEELQFISGFEKLIRTPKEMFGPPPREILTETARKIAPEWTEKKKDYRGTGAELSAFGMGSAVSPNVTSPAPLHIDPTYATEFQVLLDLANRAQKLQPFTPGR